jgi:hypothetical protein
MEFLSLEVDLDSYDRKMLAVLALDGRVAVIENGRYFLNSHGRYTEVSHGIFVYSAAHAITAMLGICLVIFAAKRMKKTSN